MLNVARKKDGTLWKWGRWRRWSFAEQSYNEFFLAEPRRVEEFAAYEIIDARVFGSFVFGRLADGRTLVVALHPGVGLALLSAFITFLPEDERSVGGDGANFILRPEIDWDTIHIAQRTYAITHDRRLVSFQQGKQPEEWEYRYEEAAGGNWIAFAYDRRTWEHMGVKADGSLWKWKGANFLKQFMRLARIHEELMETEKGKLIPDRFRPERIGFLELGR